MIKTSGAWKRERSAASVGEIKGTFQNSTHMKARACRGRNEDEGNSRSNANNASKNILQYVKLFQATLLQSIK